MIEYEMRLFVIVHSPTLDGHSAIALTQRYKKKNAHYTVTLCARSLRMTIAQPGALHPRTPIQLEIT